MNSTTETAIVLTGIKLPGESFDALRASVAETADFGNVIRIAVGTVDPSEGETAEQLFAEPTSAAPFGPSEIDLYSADDVLRLARWLITQALPQDHGERQDAIVEFTGSLVGI